MVPAVEDVWAKRQAVGGNSLPLVSPEELRAQLTQIREKAALVRKIPHCVYRAYIYFWFKIKKVDFQHSN